MALTPNPPDETRTASFRARDTALDGLRGLAALAVLLNHVGVATLGTITAPAWLVWPADARSAVMIFFILSGYVIGIVYPDTAAEKDVRHYLARRLVRLLPITTVAVLMAWALNPATPTGIVLANLGFLQNFVPYFSLSIPVVPGNENLWSLNYELVYYLAFIALWCCRIPLLPLTATTFAIGLLGWYTSLVPLFVGCYAFGFLFWLGGLALAWRAPMAEDDRSSWPTALLLLLVTCKLRGLLNVLAGFPIPVIDGPAVMLYYLDFLPASLWLVASVAQRKLPMAGTIKLIALIIPVVGLAIKWSRPGYFTPLDYRMALGTYLLALALLPWRPSLAFFRKFAGLGLVSFALYAVGRPIQTFFFERAGWFPPTLPGYVACAALTLTTALALAWVLERVVQPQVSRLWSPRTTRKTFDRADKQSAP